MTPPSVVLNLGVAILAGPQNDHPQWATPKRISAGRGPPDMGGEANFIALVIPAFWDLSVLSPPCGGFQICAKPVFERGPTFPREVFCRQQTGQHRSKLGL